MLVDVLAELNRVQAMTEEESAAWMQRFDADLAEANRAAFRALTDPPDNPGKSGTTRPATGYHDARDSVREAAARGRGTRTDRAYRRGLRGRGQRC